jgi:hypothetical protein
MIKNFNEWLKLKELNYPNKDNVNYILNQHKANPNQDTQWIDDLHQSKDWLDKSNDTPENKKALIAARHLNKLENKEVDFNKSILLKTDDDVKYVFANINPIPFISCSGLTTGNENEDYYKYNVLEVKYGGDFYRMENIQTKENIYKSKSIFKKMQDAMPWKKNPQEYKSVINKFTKRESWLSINLHYNYRTTPDFNGGFKIIDNNTKHPIKAEIEFHISKDAMDFYDMYLNSESEAKKIVNLFHGNGTRNANSEPRCDYIIKHLIEKKYLTHRIIPMEIKIITH